MLKQEQSKEIVHAKRVGSLEIAKQKVKEIQAIPRTVYRIDQLLWDAVDRKEHGKGGGELRFYVGYFNPPKQKDQPMPAFVTIEILVLVERHNPYYLKFDGFLEGEIYSAELIRWNDFLHNENTNDVPIIQKLLKERLEELEIGNQNEDSI